MEVEHTSGGAELLSDLGTVVRPQTIRFFQKHLIVNRIVDYTI